MKITFDWLKDHLNSNLKEKDLIKQLTNIGLEVEGIESLSTDKELFKIAKIIKTEKHPNADRLKVCDVNVGEKYLKKVVCGAKNVKKHACFFKHFRKNVSEKACILQGEMH